MIHKVKVSLVKVGISLRTVISKNEGSPLTNNKVMAQISRNQAIFNNLTLEVMDI